MTILVTGSTGHLGEALMRLCAAKGRPAAGLDLKPGPFTRHVGSAADRVLVRRAMAGASAVIHAATLHKPHVATHTKADFVEANITATLVLLEEAAAAGVTHFVFTSTTSAFGDALTPGPGEPAAWIDESVADRPKNIYGVTKTAAEDLCALFARNHGLRVTVLRTSRFFPEDDDNAATRAAYAAENAKANEFAHRRVDIEDAASAHLCALDTAPAPFARYIVSAPTPFSRADCAALSRDAPAVFERCVPGTREAYARAGYRLPAAIDRVYDSARAVAELGWRPRSSFAAIVAQLSRGEPIGSDLARAVGAKGYHDTVFEDGPFPLA